jgi:hypothetical protein
MVIDNFQETLTGSYVLVSYGNVNDHCMQANNYIHQFVCQNSMHFLTVAYQSRYWS